MEGPCILPGHHPHPNICRDVDWVMGRRQGSFTHRYQNLYCCIILTLAKLHRRSIVLESHLYIDRVVLVIVLLIDEIDVNIKFGTPNLIYNQWCMCTETRQNCHIAMYVSALQSVNVGVNDLLK